ncbi:putative peptidase M28 [Rosa chinensis]|uniref:Vacuolar membrane protease n=2 Tax=Rosa chinensis TaxID=74649 RepID=A0A2P6SJG5_ROSCH|nr:endoplasmic reticulum metallopeptidase 1 isoform X1 [Rosa chinensis]PRQ58809.1 putative peptidase M28 [Rosa chinensis]
MRRKPQTGSSSAPEPQPEQEPTQNPSVTTPWVVQRPQRSPFVWLTLFAAITYSCWGVYHYQFESLPAPLTPDQAGKRGFSEFSARKHVKVLTQLGPHPVASEAITLAQQYVLAEAEEIKKTAHWEVDVEVDSFVAKTGANQMKSGLFKGKTLVYSDLNHIVVRISPKYSPISVDNAVLVSSHIDTVFSTGGAGDCSSCVAVMLELARGVSQWAHGFKHAVIFLFNTGEEEGLDGAHSFITQHPWSSTIRLAIDLEAMGIGGKSGIFQAGPHPWAIENYAAVAKYPSGHIIGQNIFSSGAIKSATDFQVYKELAGLSGLDFAYSDNSAVYHTKNDKFELLQLGSLQHLGENMLAFLLRVAASSHLPKASTMEEEDKTGLSSAIYFDILGMYMIVYRQRFARMLHNSVIAQSLLIWTTSLLMGGYPAAVSLVLSCLSVILMWTFALSFSVIVAFIIPLISSSPVPYVANPWLVVGLFAAPALLGALTGQYLGYLVLHTYLANAYSKKKQLSPAIRADLVKLEAERWLYKAGSIQWLILLCLGTYYRIGSSYLALAWLVPPAFAYGFLEATLSPVRLPKPLKLATLLIGLAVPIVLSAGVFIRVAGTIIGTMVRFDRNPGGTPDWLGNVILAVFVSAVMCLTLVYLLSYIHLSGAKRLIVLSTCALFCLSLALVLSGTVPAFTKDTSRAVNVVHVVDTTRSIEDPRSYVSLFSSTPGKLTKEVELINEGFRCGRDQVFDFVTFTVKYGCWTEDDSDSGWSEVDIPIMHVQSDNQGIERTTQVLIDTKGSLRWSLAINMDEIRDFAFTDAGNSEELVSVGDKSAVDGWHVIQFAGGNNSPTKFGLTVYWTKNSTLKADGKRDEQAPLLKLRTDMDIVTPKVERVLSKLPTWCSLFGKSTSPYTFAFLSSLPVDF